MMPIYCIRLIKKNDNKNQSIWNQTEQIKLELHVGNQIILIRIEDDIRNILLENCSKNRLIKLQDLKLLFSIWRERYEF